MDQVIIHRVISIIAEMGLFSPISYIYDFDPEFCIKNQGPHRLYEFHTEMRDDVDISDFVIGFCAAMEQQNKISIVKADFYEANEYPGAAENWHTVYITVATI